MKQTKQTGQRTGQKQSWQIQSFNFWYQNHQRLHTMFLNSILSSPFCWWYSFVPWLLTISPHVSRLAVASFCIIITLTGSYHVPELYAELPLLLMVLHRALVVDDLSTRIPLGCRIILHYCTGLTLTVGKDVQQRSLFSMKPRSSRTVMTEIEEWTDRKTKVDKGPINTSRSQAKRDRKVKTHSIKSLAKHMWYQIK